MQGICYSRDDGRTFARGVYERTHPMIVLGIDPGTRRIGYALVRKDGPRVILLEAGLLRVRSKDAPRALREAKRGVDRLLRTYRPAALAIERIFFSKNKKTAMAVAECRGVILLAAAEREVPLYEYAPSEVKLRLTGDGAADKRGVLKIVRLVLQTPTLALIDDASDAVALALVACGDIRS